MRDETGRRPNSDETSSVSAHLMTKPATGPAWPKPAGSRTHASHMETPGDQSPADTSCERAAAEIRSPISADGGAPPSSAPPAAAVTRLVFELTRVSSVLSSLASPVLIFFSLLRPQRKSGGEKGKGARHGGTPAQPSRKPPHPSSVLKPQPLLPTPPLPPRTPETARATRPAHPPTQRGRRNSRRSRRARRVTPPLH